MQTSIRRPQVCVLGSADPGSAAYDLAGAAGDLLARLGITVVSGCGSPATRVAAERAIAAGGMVLIGRLDPLPILILAPKPLLAQWQEELFLKLAIPSARWDGGGWVLAGISI